MPLDFLLRGCTTPSPCTLLLRTVNTPHMIIRPPRLLLSLYQHTKNYVTPRGLNLTSVFPIYDVSPHHLPYPSSPMSYLSSLLPCLYDYCRRRSLDASEITFNVALSWSSAVVCLHHGAHCLPPPSYPVSCAHTSKIGWEATHSATFA